MKYVNNGNLAQYDSLIKKYINNKSYSLEELSYGVEWDINTPSVCTRIGNMELHRTLPIQSALRGCVCQGKNIMYYLDPNDWSKKQDGTNSRLDGYDGTVEVEIPEFYLWSEIDGDKRRVWISLHKVYPYAMKVPRMLIGAYRATVLQSVPENMGYLSTLPVNSAVSIVNTNDYCRGGNNDSYYDQYIDTMPLRSLLGKPRTKLSRSTFRTYARNAGKEILCYEYYKAVFYWLYVIEYSNFNCQDTYISELTSEGYRQGGLGSGITNWDYYNKWLQFNNKNPIISCGYGNSIGNNTGIVNIPSFIFNYTTNNYYINQWNTTNSTVVKDNVNHSITITNVLSSSSYILLLDSFSNACGNYIFNIQGLQAGQQLLFKSGTQNTIIASQDGDIEVFWNPDVQNSRYIYANFTGECNITITTTVIPDNISVKIATPNMSVPRWRGFDNTFEDIYTNLDGIIAQCPDSNYSITNIYTTTNPEYFGDTAEYKKLMTLAGKQVQALGYIKDFDLGEQAEIISNSIGTGKFGQSYVDYSLSLRVVLVGGQANDGTSASLACFNSYNGVNSSHSTVGFRLYQIL